MQKEIRDIIRDHISSEIEYNTENTGTTISEITDNDLSIDYFIDSEYVIDLLKMIKEKGFEITEKEVVKEIKIFTKQLENMIEQYEGEINSVAESEFELIVDYQKQEKDLKEVDDIEDIDEDDFSKSLEIAEDLKEQMNEGLVDDYVLDINFSGGVDHNIYEIDNENKYADRVIRKLIGLKTLELYNEEVDHIIERLEKTLETINAAIEEIESQVENYIENHKEDMISDIVDHIKELEEQPTNISELNEIIDNFKNDLIENVENDDSFCFHLGSYYCNKIEDEMVSRLKISIIDEIEDLYQDFLNSEHGEELKEEIPELFEKFRLKIEIKNF